MKTKRQFGWFLVALIVLALGTINLLAQDGEDAGIPTNIGYPNNPGQPGGPANAGSPTNDPPARVARIQYISGQVSLQPGGVNDWVAANLNRPLTTSDRVWTDKDSRVELNVGTGFVRMDSESSLTLTNVSDNTIQAELDQGVLELTVRHLEPGEIFEIDTPNLAFTAMKPGVYRIEVRPNQDQTWVTVRKGNGQATGSGPAVKVGSGEQVRFSGQNSLQHEAYAAPAPDGFDDWAQVRDKRLDGSQSARYVAPGVIGREDLDYYGTWRVVPNYGAVWVPTNVPGGWAPYRYGHWAWIAPWGWTWVDDAPWGFAPFHYGRWVSFGGYWGWAPGPVYVGWRPYYAPALVGWIGGGGWGFGISFGIGGGCGWFPLGWGEPYYPWYHGYRGGYVSQNYIRNVNVTNTHITNITNVTNNYYHNTMNNTHFVNRNVVGAVTAAPKSALANGQNIAKVGTAVPRSELGKGEVVRNVDVTPAKAAMLGGHAANATAIPPRTSNQRPVVTPATPPARTATPAIESHNVPQSPASVGVRNPNTTPAAISTHSVPRPPAKAAGGNYGTPSTPAASSAPVKAAEAVPPAHSVPRPPERTVNSTPATGGYSAQPSSANNVPKPPYAGGTVASGTTVSPHNSPNHESGRVATPPHDATPVSRPSAPTTHAEQPSKPKESKPAKEQPKANPGMASSNMPRPPASYTYHAAPSYGASSYAGGSSSYGSSRSYTPSVPQYGSAPQYGASRGSYSPPVPAYHPAPSYSPAPAYSARASQPAPSRYSAPAPSYSGGSGGGHSNSSGAHNAGHSR